MDVQDYLKYLEAVRRRKTKQEQKGLKTSKQIQKELNKMWREE